MDLVWSESLEGLDWNELSTMFRLAPLGNKSAADLQTVFSRSMYRWFVFDGGRVVAAGRALADGIDASYIADVAVHPDYQGLGIGKEIVSRLRDQSRGHRKVLLYSVPGKEAFYLKLGFKRMTTAMAIFANQDQALETGLVREEE